MLLFFLQDHPLLPEDAAALIENPARRSVVSMACLWEISIKAGLGKLNFKSAENPGFEEQLRGLGFDIQPLRWETLLRAKALPQHHRDPFDRYLVAEALERNEPILSTDRKLDMYGVHRIG